MKKQHPKNSEKGVTLTRIAETLAEKKVQPNQNRPTRMWKKKNWLREEMDAEKSSPAAHLKRTHRRNYLPPFAIPAVRVLWRKQREATA